MDFIQIQSYMGIWSGAVIMISLHNLFISIMLYKARQTNASNILKIIFNFAQILRSGANFGLYMTPKTATFLQCDALLRTIIVGNVLTRLSLAAFLLWRLRQIRNVHNYGKDKWLCIILFATKVALSVPYIIYQRASTVYDPNGDVVICFVDSFNPLPYGASGIVVEVIIDIFVTFRLVQVLVNANKNAAQVSTTNIRSKRSLFTAVMYWNFLRLFVSFIFHSIAILDMLYVLPEVESITVKYIIYIALSYVITVDAEIVRVIEGKDKKKGSSGGSGTSKSFKSIHSPHYNSSDLPKYSQHAQTSSTHSQIEADKIAVVSMKRLSFFEWANVVVGKRRKNEEVEEEEEEEEYEENNEYDDEDMEEIIDGPPKSSKDNDLEKDLSQDRRSSNFSGTTSVTETTTLDENPDIVIH